MTSHAPNPSSLSPTALQLFPMSLQEVVGFQNLSRDVNPPEEPERQGLPLQALIPVYPTVKKY